MQYNQLLFFLVIMRKIRINVELPIPINETSSVCTSALDFSGKDASQLPGFPLSFSIICCAAVTMYLALYPNPLL